MFGVDVFNYGSVFNADGDGDGDAITYFCIDCNDKHLNCKVWVNGERRKEVEDKIERAGVEGDNLRDWISENNLFLKSNRLGVKMGMQKKYLELGYVEDCDLAKKTSTNSSQDCSDTNQITNNDGTCGGCLEGYETDDDGNCVEVEEDKTLIYGALGLGALALIMVMK